MSNSLFPNWGYPYGVRDIPEPFHQLSYLYSKLHNLQPKNDDPNIVYSILEIPVVTFERNVLLISLPKCLYLKTVDTQRAYVYDSYLQLLLECEHFQNHISVPTNHGIGVGHLPLKHHNGISLPKLNGNSNLLSNENFFGNLTYNKAKTFIETKVTAMELQGFNL